MTQSKSLIVNLQGEDRKVKCGKGLRKQFLFDERYINLNHGSFGTYPRPVQTALRAFQDQAEARPDDFIRYRYPVLLDESREAVGKILNAPTDTVVFVPNATTGVNTVLRNLTFQPGDKILYFATIYGACEKSVAYITETTPAEAVKVEYTYPVEDDWLVEEFEKKVRQEKEKGNRVKIAIFDTVVSLPGLRMPFEKLTEACRNLDVLSCIDGAHGIGHVELDLSKLDPDFFVSNCHKWLFTPRGCAVLYVPLRNQPLLRSTLPTSHGFVPRPIPGLTPSNPFEPSTKSPFVLNFEFVGTIDNAPYLCVPAALKFRQSLGGETEIINYCSNLAKNAAERTAEILGTEVLNNKTGTLTNCCLSNVRLPLNLSSLKALGSQSGIEEAKVGSLVRDWAIRTLVNEYNTFIAMVFYDGNWWVRLSGQVYLDMDDFEWGAQTLKKVSERVERGEWLTGRSKL